MYRIASAYQNNLIAVYKKLKRIGFLILLVLLQNATTSAQITTIKQLKLISAVHTSIKQHPNIRLYKEQVNQIQGQLIAAEGQFSWSFQSSLGAERDNNPLLQDQRINGLSYLTQNQSYYDIGIQKQFRTGIVVNSSITLNRIEDSINYPTVPNYAEFNMTATLPLLRGRGKSVTAAREAALKIEYKASQLELNHSTSFNVYTTTIAYWNYVASYKILEIKKESELRAQKLVKETEILIEAEERPRAEINQLQANLADKISIRIAAAQDLYQSRQSLGLAMGLPNREILALPAPIDDFPAIVNDSVFANIDPEYFINTALKKRTDLEASVNRENESKVLLVESQNLEKPKLSLDLYSGYKGLNEGNTFNHYFTPFNQNISGLNFGGTLTWELPTNVHHGLVLQRNSEYQQNIIQSDEIARNIKSNVIIALNNLKSSMQRLNKSKEAITLYQSTVENEKIKFQQGLSTLIDLILYEDRLTNALLNQILAQLSYAEAIAKLRYETGTLIDMNQDGIEVDSNKLLSIPFKEDLTQ